MASLNAAEALRIADFRERLFTFRAAVLVALALATNFAPSFPPEQSLPEQAPMADRSGLSNVDSVEADPACDELREKGADAASPRCVFPNVGNPRDILDQIEAAQRQAWEHLPTNFPGTP